MEKIISLKSNTMVKKIPKIIKFMPINMSPYMKIKKKVQVQKLCSENQKKWINLILHPIIAKKFKTTKLWQKKANKSMRACSNPSKKLALLLSMNHPLNYSLTPTIIMCSKFISTEKIPPNSQLEISLLDNPWKIPKNLQSESPLLIYSKIKIYLSK